jgi:protein tyrosine phosphatase (PTP) superfamily phosphohydrolase (DUF442 family)
VGVAIFSARIAPEIFIGQKLRHTSVQVGIRIETLTEMVTLCAAKFRSLPRMKKLLFLSIIILALDVTAAEPRLRPDTWAAPVLCKNLGNFHQLDQKVYRSSQPDKKGFEDAMRLGIKNVLNLRDHHSDDDESKGLGIKTYRVRMDAGDIEEDKLIRALQIIKQSDGPILIHCWHGSDRTGLICAAYRMVFQNWTKQQALDELVNGGYGYHKRIYKNIPRWIESVDVETLKQKVFAP